MVTPSAENLPTVKPTSAVNESDKISLGYDSEYTTYERDDVRSARGEDVEELRRTYQNPITAQFALEGDFRGVQHPDLIYEVCERQKTAWVFRTPEEKMMGVQFLRWQENCLMSIFERIGLDREKAMTLDLWAFYSNAEIANFSPNHQYLKEVFEAVGEKAKLMPIQSSGIFLDIGIDLPEKWTLNIRDNRLICAAKSLKTLGESLGYPKGDLDFEKHNARWYLENERERFLDYAVRDAMIPLAWLEQFEESKAMAVEGLESSGIISKKSAEKILAKTYNTAAALTDDLMDGKLARDGKKEKYHQTVNHLIDEVIPRKFTSQNKGGFNRSSHGDRPKFFQNCDARDIRAAYLNAMMISDQPIVKPTKNLIFNDGKGEIMCAVALARRMDNLGDAWAIVDEYYNYDAPENHLILNIYDAYGDCVPARSNITKSARDGKPVAWESQMFHQSEILAQATLTPRAVFKVRQIIGWDKKTMNDPHKTASFRDLFAELGKMRDEAQAEHGKKSAQEVTLKLFGNGGVGKLAQNIEGFNPNYLRKTIINEGDVSKIVNQAFKGKCYNPFLFNKITATVRAVCGLSYALSDGIMAITDGTVFPHGKFQSSQDIAARIRAGEFKLKSESLAKILDNFEWSNEGDSFLLQLIKEREYCLLEGGTSEAEVEYMEAIYKGEATREHLEKFPQIQARKRGFKQPQEMPEREQSIEVAKLGNERFAGKPVKQSHPRLVKMGGMLHNDKRNLNQKYEIGQFSPGMGAQNIKANLFSLEEFDFRKRCKRIARNKGYADMLHVEVISKLILARQLSKKEKAELCEKYRVDEVDHNLVAIIENKALGSMKG